ncbi:multiple epidermal growth factor-like domains protein 9 isoform X2 [Silurus meridionalis]|uniref:Laminin EGF-like domain-containing protein n=1 Tax=Silurus meridionalis TaxID=175797 RepID=A0A8T0ACA8_SILME|nr:multiple epidermal growth factor-like domains protein 9 isoform X2 [Silurus meridionalis]KAF7688660.1 hypothetical protein HF521_013467 [Silurus meridionalis]
MLVVPVFEFLLLACAARGSRALGSHASPDVASNARALSDNQLEVFGATTSSPNHLPEEKLSPLTSAPFLTTPKDRSTTGLVTTTVGSSPRTMAPTLLNSTKPNISLTTTGTSNNTSSSPTITSTATTESSTSTFSPNTSTTTTTTSELTTKKGPQCNCSTNGSVDPDSCDPLTGGCKCLRGYSGLHCEQCYTGYFRNHTGACQQCDCDSSGAAGLQCNSSGVCECKAGVDGDKCTNCSPGFFNFSSTGCQACQCNNHSNTCDKQSGVCLNCQGNTRGSSCAECKPNFYREHGSSLRFPCSTCPCSIVTSSGNCTLNAFGKPVCDQCNPEYEGPNCELCRVGFYNADSICVPCDCNGNAEPSSAPRTCNPETGHCLNCSFNTTGSHCQYCAPGFTGDALVKNCTAIIPTTPLYSSTMTTSPNVTDQFPTSSTALLSGLTSASTNSTSNSELVSSWHQIRLIILAVIITLIVALLGTAGGIYTYRQYQNRKINAPFWTIELKEDNISFSSYHDSLTNADASGLLDDEACEAASNGQLTLNSPGSLYMP